MPMSSYLQPREAKPTFPPPSHGDPRPMVQAAPPNPASHQCLRNPFPHSSPQSQAAGGAGFLCAPQFQPRGHWETPPVPQCQWGERGKPRNSWKKINIELATGGNVPSNEQHAQRQMMDGIPAPFELIPDWFLCVNGSSPCQDLPGPCSSCPASSHFPQNPLPKPFWRRLEHSQHFCLVSGISELWFTQDRILFHPTFFKKGRQNPT